jgi:hypothetical protein
MIVEVSAATAEEPDPGATTAATADSSQVGADPVRRPAGDILQQSEEYYVEKSQEQNTIATDPNMSNEKRTEAAAAARSAEKHFQAVRQRRAGVARAQGKGIEPSAAATAVPTLATTTIEPNVPDDRADDGHPQPGAGELGGREARSA